MKTHPAITMMQVWLFCVAAFFLLPFELINRQLTLYGFLILALFIGAFCFGAGIRTAQWKLRSTSIAMAVRPRLGVDFTLTDRILIGAVLLNFALLVPQILEGNLLDLQSAWRVRAERADDLLTGRMASSGLLFQMSFLLYPASYTMIVREIVFRREPNIIRLAAFGLLPIVLVSLVMGGRGPILYSLALVLVAVRVRRRLQPPASHRVNKDVSPRALFVAIAFGAICLVALNYFIQVFIVRAESAVVVEQMLYITETSWGVTFSGPRAELLFNILGYGNTYLVFVFIWYLIQGLVMSNVLFTDYSGPPHFGVYGIEILTALVRRLNGEFVADRFYSLLELNTFGFLPSAFGSLYVDFAFIGLVVAFFWGYVAAIVFHKTREWSDPRWFLPAPFVLLGIFFSLINTPVGFGNGMVTHIWMVIAFIAARSRVVASRPVGQSSALTPASQ